MKLLDLDIEEFEDGYRIEGIPNNKKVKFESYDDHRIAMAFSILSFILPQGGIINNFECVNISNPTFIDQIKSIT